MNISDMPKLECPFVRKEVDGKYIVTNEIAEGYEWVFSDDSVMCIEKLHGTNVSIVIQDGVITAVFNRTERIPFFNKGKKHIIEGVLNSFEKGYMEFMIDGQYFGELLGPKINGNPYKLKEHIWIPFRTFGQKHLKFKSWGKYSKDFATISTWFKDDLIPLYSLMVTNEKGFIEGVVFTHPDGRMAKLRRDMFDWFECRRHKDDSQDSEVNSLDSSSREIVLDKSPHSSEPARTSKRATMHSRRRSGDSPVGNDNHSQQDNPVVTGGKDGNLTHESVTNDETVSYHGGGRTSADTNTAETLVRFQSKPEQKEHVLSNSGVSSNGQDTANSQQIQNTTKDIVVKACDGDVSDKTVDKMGQRRAEIGIEGSNPSTPRSDTNLETETDEAKARCKSVMGSERSSVLGSNSQDTSGGTCTADNGPRSQILPDNILLKERSNNNVRGDDKR